MKNAKTWLSKILRWPFEFLNRLPWTKPIAILYSLTFLAMFPVGLLTGKDMPPNLTQMAIWFGGAVFFLATGKSVIEKNMAHGPASKEEDVDGKDDKV